MTLRRLLIPVASVALFALSACSKSAPKKPAANEASPDPNAAAAGDHGHHPPAQAGTKLSKIDPAARVSFGNLQPGQKVQGPLQDGKVMVDVKMEASKVRIVPAGKQEDFTGHHHLVIDGKPVPKGQAVPADDKHIHYGKGQTQVKIPLTPGSHTLTMQLADGFHLSYGPDHSATVNIEVAAAN